METDAAFSLIDRGNSHKWSGTDEGNHTRWAGGIALP